MEVKSLSCINCQACDPLTPLNSLVMPVFSARLLFLVTLPGMDYQTVQPAVGSSTLSTLGRDTAMLLSDLTQGASNWIQSFLDPRRSSGGALSRLSSQRRNETCKTTAQASIPNSGAQIYYPQGFEPLRSESLAMVDPTSCPVIRNPFVSPLLAPDSMLRGLPPVHIVVRTIFELVALKYC